MKPAARDNDAIELLLRPRVLDHPGLFASPEPVDTGVQPDPPSQVEGGRVAAEILEHRDGCRIDGVSLGFEVTECRQTRLVFVCIVGQMPVRPGCPVDWPPSSSDCSKMTGSKPWATSQRDTTRPAGPAPITATRFTG